MVLVVCPNHLAQQWADEIKKYTDLKVILYTTLENIKETTYGDMAAAGNQLLRLTHDINEISSIFRLRNCHVDIVQEQKLLKSRMWQQKSYCKCSGT